LGGYTTYSTFALDALGLWERGATARMFAYIVFVIVIAAVLNTVVSVLVIPPSCAVPF